MDRGDKFRQRRATGRTRPRPAATATGASPRRRFAAQVPSHPPTPFLLAAAGSVASGALLLLSRPVGLHVVGYVLGSLVTIGLLATFVRVDATRRSRAGYLAHRLPARVTPLIAACGVLVAAAHAWAIATELAG